MQHLLEKSFQGVEEYLVISTSFEGIGDLPFQSEEQIASLVPAVLAKGLFFNNPELAILFLNGKLPMNILIDTEIAAL